MKKRIVRSFFVFMIAVAAMCCIFFSQSTYAKYSASSNATQTAQYTYQAVGCTGGTATCSQKATCTICGNQYGDYNHTGAKDWRYIESGHWKIWECCGAIATDISEHVYVEGVCECGRANHTHQKVLVPAKDPTCTESGNVTYYACTCDKLWTEDGITETLMEVVTIPATGHKWYLATCAAPKTCQNCGETEGVALEHTLETLAAVEPTCNSTGLTAGERCTVCGTVTIAQQEIGMLAHTPQTIPAVSATCSNDGASEGSVCSTCGTIITAPETILALGHTKQKISAIAATCTTTGLTEGERCTVCGVITKEQEIVDKLGHIEVSTPALAATCTQAGHTAGVRCSRAGCGEVLVPQVPIEAIGHTVVAMPEVSASCLEEGYSGGTQCSVCYEIISAQTIIPALGHTMLEDSIIIPAVAPTCAETGLTQGIKCGRCGTLTTAQAVVPANGHTEVTDTGFAATCIKNGLTNGAHCTVCGEITVPQTIIPYSGHNETTLAAKAATCTSTGLTEGKQCTICGVITVAQQTIDKKNHTVVADAAVAATCTSAGKTAGSHCSVCDTVIVAQTTIPATGHSWKAATCTTAQTCNNCGATQGAALGHTAAANYSSDASNHWKECTVCGYDIGKTAHTASGTWSTDNSNHWKECTACGYDTNKGAHSESGWKTDGTNHWKICTTCSKVTTAASAHSASSSWSTDGSNHWKDCTVCGYDTNKGAHNQNTNGGTASVHKKCSVCGRTTSTSHSYSSSVQKAATCTAVGTTKYSCACGYSYTSDDIPATGHLTTVIDNWMVYGNNCSGAATCSRCNVTVTPTVFFDPLWVGDTAKNTGRALGYDATGAGVDSNHGQAWALLQAKVTNGAYLHLNKNNALMGQYIVVHYGASNVPTSSQINVAVNNGGSGLVNWRMANPGTGFTSSLFSLTHNAGDNPFYMNINGSIIYIRGIATFTDINQARAYQALLTGIQCNDGRKTTNSGDAIKG